MGRGVGRAHEALADVPAAVDLERDDLQRCARDAQGAVGARVRRCEDGHELVHRPSVRAVPHRIAEVRRVGLRQHDRLWPLPLSKRVKEAAQEAGRRKVGVQLARVGGENGVVDASKEAHLVAAKRRATSASAHRRPRAQSPHLLSPRTFPQYRRARRSTLNVSGFGTAR